MTVKIPIKKYVMDESLSWEERYKKLEAHHAEETTWMFEELKRLDRELTDLKDKAKLDSWMG